ncbi:mitoferrin-2 isoform X1 [Pezoporus occidentalis]|uniref:mitoferrin-2 isoform X1 n=1 Tax=Pezoporus occidentalis TaxID=407982 RepID=UPI002F90C468
MELGAGAGAGAGPGARGGAESGRVLLLLMGGGGGGAGRARRGGAGAEAGPGPGAGPGPEGAEAARGNEPRSPPAPDYEALPQGAAVSTHMLAGAVAGVMEHCVMYPVDCVKTRMQSLRPEPAARYRNVLEALWRIARTEGVWRPMRGLNITATGAGPAHALYFACYEKCSRVCSNVAPRCSHEPCRSGQAEDADVQLALSACDGLCASCVAQRRGWSFLPQLHHPAHHEHPLPSHSLHDLRVPARAAQPPQTVQPRLPRGLRSLRGGCRCCSHYTFGRLQNPAQHPGVPGLELQHQRTHYRHGQCLQDGVPSGRRDCLLQRGAGESHLSDALNSNCLVCV